MSGTGDYARLMAWAGKNGITPNVNKSRDARGMAGWAIYFTIASPVKFNAHGDGQTVDAAAEKIIADLATVGVTVP